MTRKYDYPPALNDPENLQRLLEQAGDWVWACDLDGRMLYVSDTVERFTGFSPDEIIGTLFFERFSGSREAERARAAFEQVIREARPFSRILQSTRHKDGHPLDIEVNGLPLFDDQGRLQGFCGISRDFTSQQSMLRVLQAGRQQLADAERRFRALVEQSPLSIQIYSADGDLLLANRAWERLWGADAGQLSGYNVLRDSQLVRKGVMPYIERAFAGEALTTPPIIYDPSELPWVPEEQGNKERWIQAFLYPIRDERGEVKEVVLMNEDITRQRVAEARQERAEAELRAYREQLEQQVIQRTAALEAANEELAAFSYSVSHDLRAPLRSIDGFSQALLEDYGSGLDATGRDYLQRVRGATQRMGQLIDDLLMLSRLSRREMSCEQVDLSVIAEEVVAELREQYPQRRVAVEVAAGMSVCADPKLMTIALKNLIGNAWKYTATREQARIEVGCRGEGRESCYFIRDNGVGFDMRYADKLFGAFQRLHSSSEFEGSGIGLATVARIVHRHGGRVWAEAEEGVGACFYFTLGPECAE